MSAYVQSRYYRAPEVALGAQPLGAPADVWALGVTLCEIAVGKIVFTGTRHRRGQFFDFRTWRVQRHNESNGTRRAVLSSGRASIQHPEQEARSLAKRYVQENRTVLRFQAATTTRSSARCRSRSVRPTPGLFSYLRGEI